MGVRYVVVPEPARADLEDEAAPPPAWCRCSTSLAQQLDLERVPVGERHHRLPRTWRWASSRSVLPAREGDRTEPFDSAGDDLRKAQAAMKHDVGVDGADGEIPATGDLLIASTSDPGWKVRIDGAATRRTETYGWANQFGASRTGEGTLAYETPLVHRAIDLGLVVAWVLALWAWRRARRRARDPRPRRRSSRCARSPRGRSGARR